MESGKPITQSYLRRFNGVIGSLHLIQGGVMLALGLTIDNIKEFRLPWTVSFLAYNETTQRLVSQTREIARVPVGAIVSSFLFLSAIAHFFTVFPGLNPILFT